MRNLKTTPWIDGYNCKKRAKIYKTKGGKIAVQIVCGYGPIVDGHPSVFGYAEPRY